MLLLFCLGVAFSSAQSRTGTLTGLVVDDQDQAFPGIEISISSPQLIAPQLSRVSNDLGSYRFPYLPPGTYTLTASLSGFKTFSVEGISIKLGLTTNVNVKMVPSAIEEEVTVTSEAPIISVEDTKLTTNIKSEELNDLPISRSLGSIVNLAPGIIANTFMGAGSRENAYQVDGVQLTDPGSGSGLGATQSLDAYDEIQVETGGHPAEYGNAGGAVVNVITKSGGNSYSGQLSFYFQNDSLQADNFEGTGLTEGTTEILYDVETNFSIGGPILKDKLWFYISAGYNPNKIRVYGFSEEIPATDFTPIAKLTFQPNARNRFNISFNYNTRTNPYLFANPFRTPEACFNLESYSYNYNFSWLYTASYNTIFEVQGAHLFRPTSYLSRGRDVVIYDMATSIMSNSSNDCLQERLRWQAKASVTQYIDDMAGGHEWKLGIEYERGESRNAVNWFPDEYGMAYYLTMNGEPFYSIEYDPPVTDLRLDPYDQYAAYVQDSWRINKYLNLNVGFRYNYVDAYTPPQAEQTIKLPITSWHTFEPRIALGIDPFGDGKTGIKLSWSKYATMMWTWFYGLNPNGQDMTQYLVLGEGQFMPIYQSQAYEFEVDEDLKRPFVQEIFFSVDRAIGKDFMIKLSYVDRNFKDFVSVNDANYDPSYFIPYEVDNLVSGQPMTLHYRDASAPNPFDYYTNDSRAKRHYRAIILEINKRLSNNFLFRFNYTWSRLTGTNASASSMMASGFWNYPDALLYGDGILPGDRTHVIKFSGIWYLPVGFVLSANYSGSSGYPYARSFQFSAPPYGSLATMVGEDPGSLRSAFIHYFDFRLGKDFNFGSKKISLFVEAYNLFNFNQTTSLQSTINNPYYTYGQIMGIQSGRILQLGARFVF